MSDSTIASTPTLLRSCLSESRGECCPRKWLREALYGVLSQRRYFRIRDLSSLREEGEVVG